MLPDQPPVSSKHFRPMTPPNLNWFAWLAKYETYLTYLCFLNGLSYCVVLLALSACVYKGWVSNYNGISTQVGACVHLSWAAAWCVRTHSVDPACWVALARQPRRQVAHPPSKRSRCWSTKNYASKWKFLIWKSKRARFAILGTMSL